MSIRIPGNASAAQFAEYMDIMDLRYGVLTTLLDGFCVPTNGTDECPPGQWADHVKNAPWARLEKVAGSRQTFSRAGHQTTGPKPMLRPTHVGTSRWTALRMHEMIGNNVSNVEPMVHGPNALCWTDSSYLAILKCGIVTKRPAPTAVEQSATLQAEIELHTEPQTTPTPDGTLSTVLVQAEAPQTPPQTASADNKEYDPLYDADFDPALRRPSSRSNCPQSC
ncbi:hypothetical protein PENFLA_c001G10150 [Penicillium flavigenum]|uniref:Uncharacterized protein n=1 Tax=Penicillium flavigenum TaxID=254877 RepID=A0A1V6U1Z1_9EURO|nr:hypothetical protein PENFLA_c001G10150 [Penicillium flavigenum]